MVVDTNCLLKEANWEQEFLKYFIKWSEQLYRCEQLDQVHKLMEEIISTWTQYNVAWLYVLPSQTSNKLLMVTRSETVPEGGISKYDELKRNSDPMLSELEQTHEPVIVIDAPNDFRTNKEAVSETQIKTIINIPVYNLGEFLGAVGTGTFGKQGSVEPTENDIYVLKLLSRTLAAVLERIINLRSLENYQKQLHEYLLKAEAANLAKNQFFSQLSHDFRTPLNAIMGFAQVLALHEKQNMSPSQTEGLTHILDASRELLETISKLLVEASEYKASNSKI